MRTKRLEIKRGDLLPIVSGVCTMDGAPVPLVGDVTVKFLMRPENSPTPKVNTAASIFGDGTAGRVFYEWVAGDTTDSGLYIAEFEATFAPGKKQTFPRDYSFEILIFDDVG